MIGHFAPSLRLIADGVGLTLDDIRESRDVAVADRDYSFDAGEIPTGTIASIRMSFDGIVNDEPRLRFSSIWSMPDNTIDDWQPVIPSTAPPAASPGSRLTAIPRSRSTSRSTAATYPARPRQPREW